MPPWYSCWRHSKEQSIAPDLQGICSIEGRGKMNEEICFCSDKKQRKEGRKKKEGKMKGPKNQRTKEKQASKQRRGLGKAGGLF